MKPTVHTAGELPTTSNHLSVGPSTSKQHSLAIPVDPAPAAVLYDGLHSDATGKVPPVAVDFAGHSRQAISSQVKNAALGFVIRAN